ncbi:MAG: hypothetical protein JNK85_02625 [Verrucomicrobiales bacterium]|nr:hypothetical protein [Verrucomicrobiales bacterium]
MITPVLLKCPACGSALEAKDLDQNRGIAKCGHCGALMSIAAPPRADGFRARPEVLLPPALHTIELPDGLEIRRRWFTPAVIFLVIFCVAWDGFLLFWYGIALKAGAPLIMSLFPLVHVAVGAVLTYSMVASIFNTTRVRLTWKGLSISHSPVPWPGNRTISREEVGQLYCRRVVNRNQDRGATTRYEVWMCDTNGKSRKLLGAGLDEQQALFLEQRIERALGIVDRPVAGEIER